MTLLKKEVDLSRKQAGNISIVNVFWIKNRLITTSDIPDIDIYKCVSLAWLEQCYPNYIQFHGKYGSPRQEQLCTLDIHSPSLQVVRNPFWIVF